MNNHKLHELKDYLSYSSVNPQCRYFVKTDNAFTRKARLLQAMHRKESGSPCGSITKRGQYTTTLTWQRTEVKQDATS